MRRNRAGRARVRGGGVWVTWLLAPALLGGGMLAEGGTVPQTQMRYAREVVAGRAGLNCAVVDPAIFPHAAVSLRDMRLVGPDGAEVPYVLTLSGTETEETATASARDVEQTGRGLRFALEMPERAYTDVVLELAAKDFVGTAVVTEGGRALGEFAVWDLSGEGLGRSTTLHLQETAAPRLEVELRMAGRGVVRPAEVGGAMVPPARRAQTLYTVAERTGRVVQDGGGTVVELGLPARVPVERVRFVVGSGAKSFRREVRVQARAEEGGGGVEVLTGEIDRVHAVRDGVRLEDERLGVPAVLGANLQGPARVRVAVENGSAAALPIEEVELLVRERQVCFDAAMAGERMKLLYGDAGLHAPDYEEYAERYAGERDAAVATMGAEERNAAFAGVRDDRTERERHPRMVYLSVVLAVCFGGLLLFRMERLRMGGGGR